MWIKMQVANNGPSLRHWFCIGKRRRGWSLLEYAAAAAGEKGDDNDEFLWFVGVKLWTGEEEKEEASLFSAPHVKLWIVVFIIWKFIDRSE